MYTNTTKACIVAAITFSLLATTTYAQPFFGSAPTTAPSKSWPIQPMSPDDFNSTVQTLSNQNQQALKQEIKPPAAGAPPTSAPALPYTSASSSAMPSTTPTPSDQSAPAPTNSTESTAETLPPQYNTQPNTRPSVQPPAPASQPEVYSGFSGGQPSNSNGSSNSSKKSSGWNIQY